MGVQVIRTGWGLPKAQLIADLEAQAIDAGAETELRKIIGLLARAHQARTTDCRVSVRP